MAVLLVKSGKHFGKVIPLSGTPLRIGRDQAAEIRIPSTEVSRLHCELVLQDSSLLVKDLGSKNGTLINGTPVYDEITIEEGDYIQVGPMTFEFLLKKPKKNIEREAEKENIIANWLNQPEAEELLSDTTIISRSTAVQAPVANPIKPKFTPHEIPTIKPAATPSALPELSSEEINLLELHVQEAGEIIQTHWKNQDKIR